MKCEYLAAVKIINMTELSLLDDAYSLSLRDDELEVQKKIEHNNHKFLEHLL